MISNDWLFGPPVARIRIKRVRLKSRHALWTEDDGRYYQTVRENGFCVSAGFMPSWQEPGLFYRFR